MQPAEQSIGRAWPSVGRLSAALVQCLVRDADLLGLRVWRDADGCTLIDAGIEQPGSLESGRRIAEICMGGVGWVSLAGGTAFAAWPFGLSVTTARPVLACLASQYAGWRLGEGTAWFGMGSGPARARAAGEALFAELGYRDHAAQTCLVLETDAVPPAAVLAEISDACRLPPSSLTVIMAPTSSLAGTVQIVARVLEVALHKCHALKFPLTDIRDGLGRAPLPPPAPDLLTAMGRSNDAVLFGGEVQLFVAGSEAAAAKLAGDLPSSASRDYGRPFGEIFAAAEGDFYKIDPLLFSPAVVIVTALATGRSFRGGRLAPELLARSFGGAQDG